MNEVKYFGEEERIVDAYKTIKDKSTVNWSDEQYASIRKVIKAHYLSEQDFTCYFCKQKFHVKSHRVWDAEHLISKKTHPSFMFEPKNLCICCPDCNNEKRDKSVLDRDDRVRFPTSSAAYKIVHPHFDVYEEHLKVLVPGKLYEFKTRKKGRFTYRLYGLDRFMEDSGRRSNTGSSQNVRDLLKSALVDSSEYDNIEMQLLEELLLKNSSKIGDGDVISVLKKLRE